MKWGRAKTPHYLTGHFSGRITLVNRGLKVRYNFKGVFAQINTYELQRRYNRRKFG
jgi:hypothetical protein